ncbi:MAG TPA: M23 family metallopeptidase [Thermoanaerobaculia bacterium]|nr:M23 family metallopeptidase [Thermoanaerobaculia bacterium]
MRLMTFLMAAMIGTAPPADPLETGRQYTGWFYAGEAAKLWEKFTPEMKQLVGTAEGIKAAREQINADHGNEVEILSEEVVAQTPLQVYTRRVKMAKAPKPVVVQIALDASGNIAGFHVGPEQEPAPSKHLDYQTKTPLRLPFQGEWHVFWGGRTEAENYHVVSREQRFAYDLLILKDGKSHTGDGTALEQYHCFGQPILAPGAGTVAVAVDGHADQKIGQTDTANPPGNHVVIDHGNGEFSFLAHLKKGSVPIKKGDAVKPGDRIGLCGNSGNTSEPHLHYHLQTTARFGDGEGLPAQFLNYLADGKEVARGEPTRGQTVRPK